MTRPPARPIGERTDVALDLHAAALVKAYFDPVGPFAGATFDTLGDNEPDHVGADDLLAVTLLDVKVPALVVSTSAQRWPVIPVRP